MAATSYIKGPETTAMVRRNITEQLKYRSKMDPDKEAFIFYSLDGRRTGVTFPHLYSRSQKFGQALRSLGVTIGDVVILHMCNTVEYLEAMFGVIAIGAIPMMTYITRDDFSDLECIIKKTNAVGIVFGGTDQTTRLGLKRLTSLGERTFKHLISVNITDDTGPFVNYNEIMSSEAYSNIPDLEPEVNMDDIAIIVRSSGSSGQPKLVALSHFNLCNLMSGGTRHIPMPDIKIFSTSTFAWLSGNPVHILMSNWSAVTLSHDFDSLPINDVLEYTARESCNTVHFSYIILNTIVKNKMKLPPCVQIAFYGGSPIKKEFETLLDSVGVIVCNYGSTETGSIAECMIKRGMSLEDNICGSPAPGVEIKIVDEYKKMVGRGTTGTVLVRTQNLFPGYFRDAASTASCITEDKWFNMKDRGYISEEGKLYVLGRDDNCVTVAPNSIHVSEIENLIENLDLPQIKSIVVVPVPDELTFEQICACVILNDGQSLTEKEFLKIMEEKISYIYYKPKYALFMDSFPLNFGGKLDRNGLKATAMQFLQKRGQ